MRLAGCSADFVRVVTQHGTTRFDARFLADAAPFGRPRYCPWVGYEVRIGLVLDVTGLNASMAR